MRLFLLVCVHKSTLIGLEMATVVTVNFLLLKFKNFQLEVGNMAGDNMSNGRWDFQCFVTITDSITAKYNNVLLTFNDECYCL